MPEPGTADRLRRERRASGDRAEATGPLPPTPRTTVVVLGAGSGSRVGAGVNKVLLPLAGRPLLAWSVARAASLAGVDRVVVVAAPGESAEVGAALAPWVPVEGPEVATVDGGATRHASEWSGIRVVAPHVEAGRTDVVVVHDGARPLAGEELFAATVDAARRHGGALPAAPVPGLLSRSLRPVPPGLVGVQTPQAFRARALLAAYRAAEADGFEGTDTAATFARYAGLPVVAVPSGAANLKVTWPEDVRLAEELLSR